MEYRYTSKGQYWGDRSLPSLLITVWLSELVKIASELNRMRQINFNLKYFLQSML